MNLCPNLWAALAVMLVAAASLASCAHSPTQPLQSPPLPETSVYSPAGYSYGVPYYARGSYYEAPYFGRNHRL